MTTQLNRWKRIGLLATCLAGLMATGLWAQGAAPAADPEELLKAIPEDATAFVAVRSLDELDQDVIGLARMLGLPLGPNNMFPGPLDWLREQMGSPQQLRGTGGVAFVITNCRDLQSSAEMMTKLAILVPAKDPNALIQEMAGEKQDDLFMVNVMGQPFVAAVKGPFVVLAGTPDVAKQVVNAKGGALKAMSPDRVKAYAQRDLIMWANLTGVSEAIRQEVRSMMLGMMAMGNPDMESAEQSVNQIQKIFDEGQELTISISLEQRGLDLAFYYRAKPDTELGKQMAGAQATEGSLLIGLPDEPTLLAFGALGGANNESAMRQSLDQVINDKTLGEIMTAEQITALKDGAVKLAVGMEMGSLSFSNLPADGPHGLIGMTLIVKTKNSAQWQEEAHKIFSMVKDLILDAAKKEAELPEDMAKAIEEAIAWQPKAETLGSLVVDHIVVDTSKLPDVTPEDIEEMKGIIGQEGVLIRLAPVGKEHILVAFGGGPERFQKIADTVSKGASPLAETEAIKKMAKFLPPEPKTGEGYVNLDQILALVSTIMTKTGQPLPVPLQMNNAAPLIITSHKIDATAAESHLIVPMDLVLSTREVVMNVMPLMMGGGMGGEDMEMDMEMEDSGADDMDAAPEDELK